MLDRYASETENVVASSAYWQKMIPFMVVHNSSSHYMVYSTSPDYLSVYFWVDQEVTTGKPEEKKELSILRAHTFNLKTHQCLSLANLFTNWESARQPLIRLFADTAKEVRCLKPSIEEFLKTLSGAEKNFYLSDGGLHLIIHLKEADAFDCENEVIADKDSLLKIGMVPNIWHSSLFRK